MATNRSPKTRQPKETDGGHPSTSPSRASEILEASIEALSSCGQDALSQAVCSGILDPKHAVDWVERADRLIRFESDRSALRAEVPALAERLEVLLGQVELPLGTQARLGRLPLGPRPQARAARPRGRQGGLSANHKSIEPQRHRDTEKQH